MHVLSVVSREKMSSMIEAIMVWSDGDGDICCLWLQSISRSVKVLVVSEVVVRSDQYPNRVIDMMRCRKS